jgi:hypothetical protein
MNSRVDLGLELEENAGEEIAESARNDWPSIRETFGWGQDYLEQARGAGGSFAVATPCSYLHRAT